MNLSGEYVRKGRRPGAMANLTRPCFCFPSPSPPSTTLLLPSISIPSRQITLQRSIMPNALHRRRLLFTLLLFFFLPQHDFFSSLPCLELKVKGRSHLNSKDPGFREAFFLPLFPPPLSRLHFPFFFPLSFSFPFW